MGAHHGHENDPSTPKSGSSGLNGYEGGLAEDSKEEPSRGRPREPHSSRRSSARSHVPHKRDKSSYN